MSEPRGFALPADGAPKNKPMANKSMAPIVMHPDVARNLLTMKSMIHAARGICHCCAHACDMAQSALKSGDDVAHRKWNDRADLLTPIAKSFSTDMGVEVASIGVQIHGGMGFIEETGAAQFLRDARINPIYEGTNGIQAIDLVTRKLPMGGGEVMGEYLDELGDTIDDVRATNKPGFGATAEHLDIALADMRQATQWLQEQLACGNSQLVLAAATPFQSMFGILAGGVGLAKAGLAQDGKSSRQLARFYAENLVARCSALKTSVILGGESLAAASIQLHQQ